MKRSQPRRDWVAARRKVESEAACRICGRALTPAMTHTMHIIGRDRDEFLPLTFITFDEVGLGARWGKEPWHVHPDRVVAGCGQCHHDYDHGRADLAGKLTIAEELQAVADSHTQGTRESGIENARRRTAPSAYRDAS